MIQPNIVTVELSGLVFEFIEARELKTLPVDRCRVIKPGDLICFECFENCSDDCAEEWMYAIAESIEESPHITAPGSKVPMKIVRFRVVRDLTDIVLS
jgi:hypothetical protein